VNHDSSSAHGLNDPRFEHDACAVGVAFLPTDGTLAEKTKAAIIDVLEDEQSIALGWREVPVEPSCLGANAHKMMPSFAQLFAAMAPSRE